jgi:hypothetical protein
VILTMRPPSNEDLAPVNRKRRALVLSILAFVTVLSFCLWLGCQDFPQQRQRLPDGNTLRVLGVTYGRKPHLETGAPLLRFLSPIIPHEHWESVGLKTLPPFRDLKGVAWVPPEPLRLWVQFGRPFEPSSPMSQVNGVLRVWDENGNCAARRIGSLYHYDYHPVYPIQLDYYPRRGRELRLELFSDDGAKHMTHLARFAATNPLIRDYPVWTHSKFPVVARDRDLSVTLESLETGLADVQASQSLNGSLLLESGQPVWTNVSVSLHESGRVTNGWNIQSLEFRDATGNTFSPDRVIEQRSNGRIVFRCLTHLWNEPAWKIQMIFGRTSAPCSAGRREVYVPEAKAWLHLVADRGTRLFTFQVRPTIH